MLYFLFIPPGFRTTFLLADFVFSVRLTCTIEFPEFSTLIAYPIHKPTVSVTSHHGLWPVKKLNYAYGLPNESFTVGFFMALPCLKERFYLPFYLQHMQWRPYMHAQSSTLLHLPILCSSNPLMEGGTAMREIVPREWNDQNATSPEHQINTKSDPFPNLLFFIVKLWPPKAAVDPRTQVQQLSSNKMWFHFLASSL